MNNNPMFTEHYFESVPTFKPHLRLQQPLLFGLSLQQDNLIRIKDVKH